LLRHGSPRDGVCREFGPPAFDTTGTMSFVALQQSNDVRCPPSRSCWQAGYLDELEPAIETIVGQFESVPSGLCLSEFLTMSGAIADVPEDATAFGRRSGWVYNIITMWDDEVDDEQFIGWARDYHEALAAYPGEGTYINFLSSWEDERVREAYGEAKLHRLAAIKGAYDPGNLFRVNHNIAPTFA
jgi:FAD/FMN-containing dehydrogenase